MEYIGEIAGLLTALCWTATAMSFQIAARKIGSLALNFIRLLFAFVFYVVYMRIFMGQWLPLDASPQAWLYLGISGIIGFVLGDFFLFKSYEYISSKISMLIMTLAPPIAFLMGYLFLHESFTVLNILGMVLIMGGVSIVVLKKDVENGIRKNRYPLKGVLYAFLGAIGQGVGAFFSKKGMAEYDPFASSQIRVITGIVGFAILITILKKWKMVHVGINNTRARKALLAGSFFGPFLGVSLGMVAFKYTGLGIASTLMATVPVFILLPSHIILKEKLTVGEIVGALLAVGGISIFFL